MSADTTQKLSLPFLQPGQALKTITHNEALQRLDTGLYLAVSDMAATTLPNNPVEGQTLILADAPDADLITRAGQIAVFAAGIWNWFEPRAGWIIWDVTGQKLRVFDSSAWVNGTVGSNAETVPKLGVNTSAQDHQRLAVASESALFTHTGDSHRLILNRADAADTASLVFQTEFSGQAEFGLTGTSGLTLKTSQDGSNWTERLSAPDNHPGIHAPAFGSKRITLENDSAQFVPTPTSGGIIALMVVNDSGFPQAQRSAILAYDTGLSPNLVSLATTAFVQNHDTTILDGSISANGRIGVSAAKDGLYIENRMVSQQDVSLTFLC